GADRTVHGRTAELKQLAADRGIADRIHFLGFREDVELAYAACDVLLHPSIAEPFGLVLVEAMAMKRPVVAFDACGPTEIVVDGETGRLLPPAAEPRAAAIALAGVLSDRETAARMGDLGWRRAHACFDARAYAANLVRVCDELIG